MAWVRVRVRVWFKKLVFKEEGVVEDFLEARQRIFSEASTHSIIDIICMGKELKKQTWQSTSLFLKSICVVYHRDLQKFTLYTGCSHKRLVNSFSFFKVTVDLRSVFWGKQYSALCTNGKYINLYIIAELI